MPLIPGLKGQADVMVVQNNTAQAVGSGLAPVFGTPSLIALLEAAAVAAVSDLLPPGQTSVGVHLDVRHLAATPIGMRVRAEATLTAVDGRRLTFAVVAYDEVEQVAEGIHQRVVVDFERFMEKAATKAHQLAFSDDSAIVA